MNTSTGLARIHDCRIRSNGADGVKFVQHDTQIPRREVDGTPVTDFCSSGTIAQQIFPIYTVAQQFKTSYRPIKCQKVRTGWKDRDFVISYAKVFDQNLPSVDIVRLKNHM